MKKYTFTLSDVLERMATDRRFARQAIKAAIELITKLQERKADTTHNKRGRNIN